jgi:hypothetical protein
MPVQGRFVQGQFANRPYATLIENRLYTGRNDTAIR